MKQRDFVTIADLSKEKIQYLIDLSQEFEKHPNRELLKGKVIASLFFEPSTRTRLSFETAANRLGARIIGFSDAKATSVSKGETLKDTILMVAKLCRRYRDAPLHRRGCSVCQRGVACAYYQRRRWCTHASFTVHARPLLHI